MQRRLRRRLKSEGKEPGGDDTSSTLKRLKLEGKEPGGYDTSSTLKRVKLEGKDLEGDDTSSTLKLKEQELESEGKYPTAGQQSQVKMKVTPEMNPEHSPDFDL